ncbi:hypothetical protein F4823DRAFT_226731 [Ustulina deusta]|nr:hypothetical protein F4823DRAFT_226731 [Ustulina deusta]
MSSIFTTDHHGHYTLDQLPVELVVHIMKASPSLSALWSFINASARLAGIFRGSALEITEAVLRCTVPDQTQVFLRAVIQLRSSLFPPSLDAATRPATLGNPLGPAPATTPEILRSFILLAHRIHALAHECIEHYIKTCMAMNPSYLDDPTFRGYNSGYPLLPVHLKRPKGRPYQPKDTGPPSWAEEQLVIWNLWRVQYYYDIRAAHDVGRLEWSVAEQEELLSMTLPEFYRLVGMWRLGTLYPLTICITRFPRTLGP